MHKLIAITITAALAAILAGCATKSRSFDAKGMYVSETGQLAVGYVHVDAIPEGIESAVVHYEEDVALLSPSTKTHDIDIILTGINAVASSEGIVEAICNAFVAVAPNIAKIDAESASKGATSPIDLAKANSDNKKAAKLAKIASPGVKAATSASTSTAASDATATQGAECANGACDPCANGACDPK